MDSIMAYEREESELLQQHLLATTSKKYLLDQLAFSPRSYYPKFQICFAGSTLYPCSSPGVRAFLRSRHSITHFPALCLRLCTWLACNPTRSTPKVEPWPEGDDEPKPHKESCGSLSLTEDGCALLKLMRSSSFWRSPHQKFGSPS